MKKKVEKKVIGYLVHYSNIGIDCYFADKKPAEVYFEKAKTEHTGLCLQSFEMVIVTLIDDKIRPVKTTTNITLVRQILKV